MVNVSKEFEKMYQGNETEILNALTNKASLYRVNGIMAAVQNNKKNNAILKQIDLLRFDNSFLFGQNVGPKIAEFAIAALHLLGQKQYKGQNKNILDLISSKMEFY